VGPNRPKKLGGIESSRKSEKKPWGISYRGIENSEEREAKGWQKKKRLATGGVGKPSGEKKKRGNGIT